MLLWKPLSIAICTALTAFHADAQSDDDTPTPLQFFDQDFEVRRGTDDDAPLADTRIPRKCIDDMVKGKAAKRECREWFMANPDFSIPTSEPTTMAPTPFFHISSSLKGDTVDPVMEVKLKPVDDTFIEVWRPDEPLGGKEKLKIDAIDGIPTKVIMMKFALGHVLREYHEGEHGAQGIDATLTGAKLRLFAITGTRFGGYIEEIENDWQEETAVWEDYVRKGKRGSYAKEAAELLPSDDDVIGTFGNVTEGYWYEADLTEYLIDIFNADQDELSSQFSLRITTDSADGVIYASKENEGYSPELLLDFTFSGEVELDNNEIETDQSMTEADLDQSIVDVSTTSPTISPKEDVADIVDTSMDPSMSPVVITQLPTLSPEASTDDIVAVVDETLAPVANTLSPSQKPTTSKPTEAPADEVVSSFEESTTSAVSSSFKMTVTAIEEFFRMRNLRHGSRDLSAFMSVNEKERPALKTHLLRVFKTVLDNPPEDIVLSFEDDVIVETIDKSEQDNGGVIRTSTFRVIGNFNQEDVEDATAAKLAELLDQTITYAFVGFQKKSFIEILSNTGRSIYSKTASIDVSVTKIDYAGINGGSSDNLAFATDNDSDMHSQQEDVSKQGAWIQPTLIAGAALLFVATSSAALLVSRLKSSNQPASEIQGKPTSDESPRSLEETAAPSTPSPAISLDRWKKKKFDYAEFHDDPDAEESACEMSPTTSNYINQPARDIKFSQFMSTSFEDSSVSDVSAHMGPHMLGAKGSMKENQTAKEESSQAGSYLLDTTMDSYQMETMSDLNARLENVLQLDGASPQGKFAMRADDASHMTVSSKVPSELYSDLNTSTDSAVHSYDYDTGAAYASHLITLDMIKNNENMPPPPSDVASESSSARDDRFEEVDQNLFSDSLGGPEDRLIENAKSHQSEPSSDELKTKTEMINDELSKVMKLLKTPNKDENGVQDYGSPESSAEIYIPSESDTESASLASSTFNLAGFTKDDVKDKSVQKPDDKNDSTTSTDALNNADPQSQENRKNVNKDLNVPADENSSNENEENDPLQAMNVALNECIQILDKAAARD